MTALELAIAALVPYFEMRPRRHRWAELELLWLSHPDDSRLYVTVVDRSTVAIDR